MNINLDSKAASAYSLQLVGVVALLFFRGWAIWALWTLYLAPVLPLMGTTYLLDRHHVWVGLIFIEVVRGLSWPSETGDVYLKRAFPYAIVAFLAAWLQGEAEIPTALDGVGLPDFLQQDPAPADAP